MANGYWLLEQLVIESSMRVSYERIVESFSSYTLLVCPSFSLPNFLLYGLCPRFTRPYLAIGQGGQLHPQRNWLQSIIKYHLFTAAS